MKYPLLLPALSMHKKLKNNALSYDQERAPTADEPLRIH
jgi:hypothetical protein